MIVPFRGSLVLLIFSFYLREKSHVSAFSDAKKFAPGETRANTRRGDFFYRRV
jgi:hypothetical protein